MGEVGLNRGWKYIDPKFYCFRRLRGSTMLALYGALAVAVQQSAELGWDCFMPGTRTF